MNARPQPEDPLRLAELVRAFAREPASALEPCPDENLLAGFGAGALLAAERARVELHLAACASCRVLVAELAREPAFVPQPDIALPVGARLTRSRVLFASLLAAAAAFVVWLVLGHTGGSGARSDPQLVALADRLRAAHPELFVGFAPLDHDERVREPGPLRGDTARLLLPVGITRARRPSFLWEPVRGAESYDVALRDAAGNALFAVRCTAPPLAFPSDAKDLQPAMRYTWELRCAGPLGTESGDRIFQVASDAEGAALQAAFSAIDAQAPAPLATLARAHYALRRRFLDEAVAAARTYVDSHSDDRVGTETLLQALTRIGASEADALRARLLASGSGR